MICSWPELAAQCSGVHLLRSRPLTLAPFTSSRTTMSTNPSKAAMCSGDCSSVSRLFTNSLSFFASSSLVTAARLLRFTSWWMLGSRAAIAARPALSGERTDDRSRSPCAPVRRGPGPAARAPSLAAFLVTTVLVSAASQTRHLPGALERRSLTSRAHLPHAQDRATRRCTYPPRALRSILELMQDRALRPTYLIRRRDTNGLSPR